MSESKVVLVNRGDSFAVMSVDRNTVIAEFDGTGIGHDAALNFTDGYNRALNAAPSADQGELIKRLMHRVGDYDDPDLCARGKYYTQSDKMVDRRIIAALQSAEARINEAAEHVSAVDEENHNLKRAKEAAEAGRKDAAMLDGSDAAELTRKLLWHAQNFEKVDSLTLRKAVALIQSQANDTSRIDWFEKHTNMELAHEWGEDSKWKIFRVSGMPNDREFAEISNGDTVREAIDAAIAGK